MSRLADGLICTGSSLVIKPGIKTCLTTRTLAALAERCRQEESKKAGVLPSGVSRGEGARRGRGRRGDG